MASATNAWVCIVSEARSWPPASSHISACCLTTVYENIPDAFLQLARFVFHCICEINCRVEICARVEVGFIDIAGAERSRPGRALIDWRIPENRTPDWFSLSTVKQTTYNQDEVEFFCNPSHFPFTLMDSWGRLPNISIGMSCIDWKNFLF